MGDTGSNTYECIAVSGEACTAGAPVILDRCSSQTQNRFSWVGEKYGPGQLASDNCPGLCAGITNGTAVALMPCEAAAAKAWVRD